MGATGFVCPNCGADRFEEEVVIHTTRTVRVEVRDGRATFRPDPLEHVDDLDITSDGPVTCRCGATVTRGDVPRATVDVFREGDGVILPDGLRGEVAKVRDDGRIAIVGWHELFAPRELQPAISSKQVLALEIAR